MYGIKPLTAAVVAIACGVVLLGTASGAGAARGRRAAVVPGSRYLALGDSVTFGYMEPGVVPSPDYQDASSFIAYPEMVGAELHLKVANAACPGETSASLIDPKAKSNGCENTGGAPGGYRTAHPLHLSYGGSQLAYALGYLRKHRDVSLVSLMIGANDGLLCIETSQDACSSPPEMTALQHQVQGNVRKILTTVRTQAHYRGVIAIVNYYSPVMAYNSRAQVLNQTLDVAAKPFGVVVADGYGEFAADDSRFGGDACAAGLVTQLGTPGKCGIHPSYAGQALLAQALEKAIRVS